MKHLSFPSVFIPALSSTHGSWGYIPDFFDVLVICIIIFLCICWVYCCLPSLEKPLLRGPVCYNALCQGFYLVHYFYFHFCFCLVFFSDSISLPNFSFIFMIFSSNLLLWSFLRLSCPVLVHISLILFLFEVSMWSLTL